MITSNLPPAWAELLAGRLPEASMRALSGQLAAAAASGATIYPPRDQWFAALEAVAPQDVRVVILGQDPYHGAGQAHGLSFSVLPGVKVPPSLKNIYKELASDMGARPANHGYLQHWADQGVLLLNAVLTVEAGKAASHRGWGWEAFTDAVISAVAAEPLPKIFILWGSHAQSKTDRIPELSDKGVHLILRAPHPSPLSAYHGFFGTGPFSKSNAFLTAQGRGTIDWQLPDLDPYLI